MRVLIFLLILDIAVRSGTLSLGSMFAWIAVLFGYLAVRFMAIAAGGDE